MPIDPRAPNNCRTALTLLALLVATVAGLVTLESRLRHRDDAAREECRLYGGRPWPAQEVGPMQECNFSPTEEGEKKFDRWLLRGGR